MEPILAFDIETVPDTASGRRLYALDGLNDEDVARAMHHRRAQQTGRDFLPLHQHRVVAISVALRREQDFRLWTLGEADDDEGQLIARFFEGIERYRPMLVSWNGGGFDLPVLHYRALLHGVSAPRYWDTGRGEREARWNNYLNRFHERHTDLMDVLSGYQLRGVAPLDEIAVMLGLPGKQGMDGSQVWENFLAGRIQVIRDYCETDVANTYLIYLRFQLMRGLLDEGGLAAEETLVQDHLAGRGEAHLQQFMQGWS
jgi:predicted PolB exonuclease-like 3'-5' exonuclease